MFSKVSLLAIGITAVLCTPKETLAGPYKEAALRESKIAIHPGVPGKVPFWNGSAKRFIYAPSFDFKPVANAVSYRYDLKPEGDETTRTFEAKTPYEPMSPVWDKIPTGKITITVTGLDKDGTDVGVSGMKKTYRAAAFDGIYHKPPVMPYDKSASLALDNLLHKDYVNYWLEHGKPDFEYMNYRYPSKIYSALIVGAITQAELKPEEADRSTSLARTIADYMLEISVPKGSKWEYFAPTYYGPKIKKDPPKKKHMVLETIMTPMGVDTGYAYLNLYDLTKDRKYLDAAKRISDTYLKNQLDSGTWYLFVNKDTGKPFSEQLTIPTAMINYFNRLAHDYDVKGLDEATSRALTYIMENTVKTFDWHGQFEDISPAKPYTNHSREQACELAMYLFKNKQNLDLAESLVRFAEDQFVIWQQPRPATIGNTKNPVHKSTNWISPSVQEQYHYWMPVGRAAGIMIDTYWNAYAATGKEMYLAKAKSIANALTVVQKAHDGDFPTMSSKYPSNKWLNSAVYPAKILMELDKDLESVENEK